MMPMNVNRPMMPKMNAPSRMRIGHGMSGVSILNDERVAPGIATGGAASATPGLALELGDDRLHPVGGALVVVAGLELRRHPVADDAARRRRPSACLRGRSPPRCAACGPAGTITTSTPLSLPFCPSFHASKTRPAYSSMLSPAMRRHGEHRDLVAGRLSSCALSAAVNLSRVAGDRISALSTTRPLRKGTSAARTGAGQAPAKSSGASNSQRRTPVMRLSIRWVGREARWCRVRAPHSRGGREGLRRRRGPPARPRPDAGRTGTASFAAPPDPNRPS